MFGGSEPYTAPSPVNPTLERGKGAWHPTLFAANNVACLRTPPIALPEAPNDTRSRTRFFRCPPRALPGRISSDETESQARAAGRLFVRKFEPRGPQGRSKAPRSFSFRSSQAAPSIRNPRSPGQQRDALWQPLFPSCSLWFKSRWLCAATRSEVTHLLQENHATSLKSTLS